jgi:hypothetical protein
LPEALGLHPFPVAPDVFEQGIARGRHGITYNKLYMLVYN